MKKIYILFFILITTILHAQANEKFIITTNYGLAFRVGKTPDNIDSSLKSVIKDLKSGSSFDISMYYRLKGNGGIGLKYNQFNSSGSSDNVTYTFPNGNQEKGYLGINNKIFYIGPSFIIDSFDSNSKHQGLLDLSIGYIGYRDQMKIIDENFNLKGGNLGLVGSLGYRYCLSKFISVGPQVNFVGGTIKKFKMTGENGYSSEIKFSGDEGESLWRIDLTIGATFNF